MKPPYSITENILSLVAQISEKIGEINAYYLHKPATELRKKNRIKTIQASLEIEGNTLTEEQITALLNNKRVLAPQKDILEVQNAIKVYELLQELDPHKLSDLCKAHKYLMEGLIDTAGELRTKNVGIVKGSEITHIAPGGNMVKGLMNDLFNYLKSENVLILIKSCVFHYELEFIHPFIDGNGRMGRLWQTILLMQKYPVFEYLPVETLIKNKQSEYYNVLAISDKSGNSTHFIEFMLAVILEALKDLFQSQNKTVTKNDRIFIFKDKIGKLHFARKEYLQNFKDISQSTASRDLQWAISEGILSKVGDKRNTKYRFIN